MSRLLPTPFSTNYANFTRTWKYAYKYRAVAERYRFEKMDQRHLPHLMDLTGVAFQDGSITLVLCGAVLMLTDERSKIKDQRSITQCMWEGTGVSLDECRKGYEGMFLYSIAANSLANLSDICYDNKTNQPVGFRMTDPYYRDPKKAPFPVPEEAPLNKKEELLLGFIDNIYSNIWKTFPEEEVVVKPSLIYVHPAHRGSGLFKVYAEYDLDFPAVTKQTGAKYYTSLVTALKTKVWCENLGETLIYTSSPNVTNVRGETVPMPEGEILVYAKDMRTNVSINVKPCWEKMRACGMMPK